jgi:hypothetical protein
MTALLAVALDYAVRGIPVYPVHWPRPTLAGPPSAAPAGKGLPVIGRPSIRWSATASSRPPPTPTGSAAGGDTGPRPMSA